MSATRDGLVAVLTAAQLKLQTDTDALQPLQAAVDACNKNIAIFKSQYIQDGSGQYGFNYKNWPSYDTSAAAAASRWLTYNNQLASAQLLVNSQNNIITQDNTNITSAQSAITNYDSLPTDQKLSLDSASTTNAIAAANAAAAIQTQQNQAAASQSNTQLVIYVAIGIAVIFVGILIWKKFM